VSPWRSANECSLLSVEQIYFQTRCRGSLCALGSDRNQKSSILMGHRKNFSYGSASSCSEKMHYNPDWAPTAQVTPKLITFVLPRKNVDCVPLLCAKL
jgi:hypothetical protein